MMASATGIPDGPAATRSRSEEEPLLGGPGDASQTDGKPLWYNLGLGTGVLAQIGLVLLVAIVWGGVLSHPLILFSAHPLLNSAGLLILGQGILILQPTHTAEQKRNGTLIHAGTIDLSIAVLLAGLVVIEYNKISHQGTHFDSPHAYLGVLTYILILTQSLVGITQYFVPSLYGGVDNAKKLYKYHRISGYLVFTLALATTAAATQTPYVKGSLHIQLWAVILASIVILAGILPRIRLSKFGWLAGRG